MMLRALPFLLLLTCAGCAAPERPRAEAGPSVERASDAIVPRAEESAALTLNGSVGDASEPQQSAASAGNSLIARVDGRPITAAELISLWLHRDGSQVREYLEELIVARLTEVELERLQLVITDAQTEAAYLEALEALREQVTQIVPGASLEDFITKRLGLDPPSYMRRVRETRRMDLALERCVRSWIIAQERAQVRVILVEKRSALEAVQAALAAGGDFSEVAREHSMHPSKEDGGRVPTVVRSSAALSRLAFSTPIGQIGGPVYEEGSHLLLKVDARPAVVTGSWDEVRAAVESSLAAGDVEDAEYWQWKEAMRVRYEVDMAPLFELVEGLAERE